MVVYTFYTLNSLKSIDCVELCVRCGGDTYRRPSGKSVWYLEDNKKVCSYCHSKMLWKIRKNDPEFIKQKRIIDKEYRSRPDVKIKLSDYGSKYYIARMEDPNYRLKQKERKRLCSIDYHHRVGKQKRLTEKQMIMDHYGGKCACCGIKELEFLTIDHMDGGGNQHRKYYNLKGGKKFYTWLIKNDFPKGFQVLCHNCNFAESHYDLGCPHKRIVQKEGDV